MAYEGKDYQKDIEIMMGCERCSLRMSRTNVVVYRGNPRTDLMVIAEAPGYVEDREGKAMVGPTGSFFVDIMRSHGFSLRDYYITNCCLCMIPGNADPNIKQLDACSRWLNWQIDIINPKWILAVGRIAYSRLNPRFRLNVDKITRAEGEIVTPLHLHGIKVAALQHPSAIVRRRHPTAEEGYSKKVASILEEVRKDIDKENISI